jgi:hypothetical protein
VEHRERYDLDRIASLWRAFDAPRAIIERGAWVDKPSVNIPLLYIALGLELAELENTRGNSGRADSVFALTRRAAASLGIRGLPEQLDASRKR